MPSPRVLVGSVLLGAASLPCAAGAGDIPFVHHILLQDYAPGLPDLISHSVAADMDDDGDLDIVGVGQGSPRVFWLENQGRLSFILRPVGTAASDLAVGDYDGDGHLDVMAIVLSQVRLYRNQGGTPPQFEASFLFEQQNGLGVAMGDLDSDGDLDIVTMEQGVNPVSWHEQLDGGDLDHHEVPLGTVFAFHTINIVDLNGDKRADILFGTTGNGHSSDVYWLRQSGGGGVNFSATSLATGPVNFLSVATGDVNGDGTLDIVYTGYERDEVMVLLNGGGFSPQFDPVVLSMDPDSPTAGQNGLVDGPNGALFADLDNDGDLDVVVTGDADDQIAWFENIGLPSNEFERHVIAIDPDGPAGPAEGICDRPRYIVVGDFDGDGDLDLIVSCTGNDILMLWESRPTCREDLDGDGMIAFADVNIMLASFNSFAGDPEYDDRVDVDQDGDIDFADLNTLVGYFNSSCGEFE